MVELVETSTGAVRAGGGRRAAIGALVEMAASLARGEGFERVERSRTGGDDVLRELGARLTALGEELLSWQAETSHLRTRLRESEARYRGLFDNATVGIFELTRDGRVDVANQALCDMLGYRGPEELRRHVTDFFERVVADAPRREELLEQLERAHVIRGREVVCRCHQGDTIPVQMSVQTIRDSNGDVLRRQGIVEDLSDRRQLERYRRDGSAWPVVVRSLGGLAVLREGRPVPFAAKVPRKPLQLLELLVVRGGCEVAEAWVADILWPDADGDAAGRSLTTNIHRLRHLLEENDLLNRRNRCLTLDRERCWVDVWALEDELRVLSRLRDVDAIASAVDRVSRLYRGPFMPHSNVAVTRRYDARLYRRTVDVLAGSARRLEAAGALERAGSVVVTIEQLARHLPLDGARLP